MVFRKLLHISALRITIQTNKVEVRLNGIKITYRIFQGHTLQTKSTKDKIV